MWETIGKYRISTVRSSQGLSLSISLSIDVLLLSNFYSRVVAHYFCTDSCSLLIFLLNFSSLACQKLVVIRHCTNNFRDIILMPWEKPHLSNWCRSNKWWIMQCMNLQLSHQMTTALITSHGSRVARTVQSSYPATKALVKSRSRKQAIFEVCSEHSKLSKNVYMLGVTRGRMLKMTEIWCFWCRTRAEKAQLQRTRVCYKIHQKENKPCLKSTWFMRNSL